ncbi:MAG: 4-hydroxythreonine-4-phosphate dehydrogenase PdxA [Pseudomonadota bacterium]
MTKPTLALALGDPAGISPELTARALADGEIAEAARLVVFGDKRVLDRGARDAGVELNVETADAAPDEAPTRHVFIDRADCDPASIPRGEISEASGGSALGNFRAAISYARSGPASALTFTPFNKAAMRLVHPAYEDEVVFLNEELAFDGEASEFNILPNVWNARVTSHVPLSGVAPLMTIDRIVDKLAGTEQAMKAAGIASPRIAVAGLNPHAGDNGNFGREEIEVIAPAVAEGRQRGIVCEGPFPSDTVFLRAKRGDFDAVLTMFHDQGQIAIKMMGFDEGVTLLGGYPFPVCTPAHGTAYDIAGQGKADFGATRAALQLAARLAHASAPA